MPRGENKPAKSKGGAKRSGNNSSNNNNNNDTLQTLVNADKIDDGMKVACDGDDGTSVNSDVTCSTAITDEDPEDGLSDAEKFEAGIKAAIELAQEKSLKHRLKGLTDLKILLQTSNPGLSYVLETQYVTIGDVAERCLKRKGGSASAVEKMLAARLACALMIVAMNMGQEVTDEVYLQLQPALLQVCQDPTCSPPVREAACQAVSVLAYFGAVEYTHLQESINALHGVFSKALPKGDGELPTLKAAALAMHAAALQGFTLLLPLTDGSDLSERTPALLEEMMSLLQTKALDMRCEGGVGIALVYELVRLTPGMANFRWRRERELLSVLDELATDSHKHRGKKERKTQRSVFRAVLTQVLDDDFELDEMVEFRCSRARGCLSLESWALRQRYQAVCYALEQGINRHLVYNNGLRASFDLTDDDLQFQATSRDRKAEGRRDKDAETKKRLLRRGKNRDNRHNDCHNDDEY